MVTRVWGKADSFELVFSPLGASKEQWEAKVPADLEDGQYAVELYCCDDAGSIAYWTGMLYLNNSEAVRVRIASDPFKLWLIADIEVSLKDELRIWLKDEAITLRVSLTDYIGRG